MIYAPALRPGDTIALVSPSHVATPEGYAPIIANITAMGFRVKLAPNLFHGTYGYAATEADRIADFNAMVNDPEVKMVFFGGGEGSIDLLSHIDYAAIARNPKLFASYSDGTSILEAIYANTDVVTYYGIAPGHFKTVDEYVGAMFRAHLCERDMVEHPHASRWYTLCGGAAEGTLIGGYNWNFALLQGSPQWPISLDRDYILFIEDHEKFGKVQTVSMFLSHVFQSALAPRIKGFLFGNYADVRNEALFGMLTRIGEARGIPVVYCDDFGHGAHHAMIPIGAKARLDADAQSLVYLT